jgi:hypothetical protein
MNLRVLRLRVFLVSLSFAVVCGAAAADQPPVAAHLVGYGRITMEVSREAGGGVAVFRCADAAHADRLLSKLRADVSWDRVAGPSAITLASGAPAVRLRSGSVIVLACRGEQVYGIVAPGTAEAEAALARRGLQGARFVPQRRHPMSLDFFDLRAVSMYQLPLNVLGLAKGLHRYEAEVLRRPVDFWAPFDMGYSQFGPYFGLDELADGAAHFFPFDRCIALSGLHDSVFMTHCGQMLAPWWMRNRFPGDVVQWDPSAITGWGSLGAMGGTHLSQWATDEAYAYAQRFTTATLERLRREAGDRLGCFRVVGGGHPGDEMGMHHMSTEFMDYDPAGQAAFRRWLRDERKLDLAALGQRWYGDPGRFRAWEEVTIPSHFEFFGGFGHGTFDLLKAWHWRPDSPQAEAEGWTRSDYRPGDQWTPVDLAPSMKQLFLFGSATDKQLRQGQSTVAWFRKEFDATAWLAARRGEQVYLVAQVGDARHQPVDVFLNDAYLGPIRPKTVRCGPIAMRVTGLVKPGRNVLVLKVASGLIRGPVFLGTEQPRRYPYLGKHGNARWLDLRGWTVAKLVEGWKREARLGREMLPDTPLLFCPGGYSGYWDRFHDLKRELGIASVHFTGSGSGYMPWWAGLGYVLGAYMTTEEGGTISDPDGLSRELAWMLLGGEGHHNYYYSAIDYMELEQRTRWFSKNRRLLELMGKAAWQRPPVAVFCAARTARDFPYDESSRAGDLGLGALQAAHYPNVYLTETEFKTGRAGDYPVVFDAANPVFDDELLAGIERYVRGGGTFVALADTGRHRPLEPDTWPISRLSGFRVCTTAHAGGSVTIPADNPLLRRLAGRSLASEEGLALEATDPSCTVLARWKDGSAVAGARTLGRGRVVVIAGPFWRSVESEFLADLLAGLGVPKPADIGGEDIWVRRFTTKNGLAQWVMLYNAGRAAAQGLTLSVPLAERPGEVLDEVSGRPVPFTWADNTLRVDGLDLAAGALRVLSISEADGLEAFAHWFAEKRRYESRPAAPRPATRLPTPPASALVMDRFQFRMADAATTAGNGWLSEPTDGLKWRSLGYGFWDELGLPARGVGLYRRTFRVPHEWSGRRVVLGFVSFDWPVFLEQAEVFVNRQPVGEYRGHAWSNFDVLEITDKLQPGDNDLALRVSAEQVRGGYLGQLVAYPLERLEGAIELKQNWKLYADNVHSAPATLPLTARGRHLETRVTLPAAWKGKHVFLEFEVADRWVGCVVINGRVITYNQSCHPYANLMQVNLCPWARPGEENTIELWHYTPNSTPTVKMTVKAVRVGTVSRP